jgi:SAM-dependent methyltransferase
MLDYDREAAQYDATRGGDARACAAAHAVDSLLPPATTSIADAGCGTGIVTVRLARPGRTVVGVDRSAGMARVATTRLPGQITLGDVARLPLASEVADAVTMVWLLQLLSPADSASAVAEAGRVLRPGGLLVTTVDKGAAAYGDTDDAGSILRAARAAFCRPPADGLDRLLEIGARCGLTPAGQTTFAGVGQGLSPRNWRERLAGGKLPWTGAAGPDRVRSLVAALAALPGQDRLRPDPVYRLAAWRKGP